MLRRPAAGALVLALLFAVSARARGQGDEDVLLRPERMTAGVADQLLGQLTPDGKTLYFVSNRNAVNEVYRQDEDASRAQLVFDEGADVTWPRLSPDGKRILYISFRDDASGQLCVRDLPDKRRRCLKKGGSAVQAQWIDARRIALVSRASLEGDLQLSEVQVSWFSLRARPLVQRNLMSPAVSPDGRWIVYVPVQRYVENVGPAFAARAAERLEAMRLDRPADPPRPLKLDVPGLTGQPAFSVDGKFLYFTQFLNDSNGDGEIDASDNGVLFRVPFEPGRDDAPARAAVAWPEQLTESTWNCQYPSPAKDQLITTCSRGKDLDVYTLPPDGMVPGDWSRDRLRLEVDLSVRYSEQLLMYRHLANLEPTVTRRRIVLMRILRLHLMSNEFDAAQFYADKIGAMRDPATAGMTSTLKIWIEQRRAANARERGRLAGEFVSEARERFDRLGAGRAKTPASIALRHVVRSEIADSIGDKDVAQEELEAVSFDDLTVPSVIEAYYERADALYRELDNRDALVAACMRLAQHPSVNPGSQLDFARAAVRAMVRGLPYDEADRRIDRALAAAPADSELRFALELGRVVNTIRSEEPPRSVHDALVALYEKQTRPDRQRAVVLDGMQRAARFECEQLVESLAKRYVDDAPKGTGERSRAERLYERVMLGRAYRRRANGKPAEAERTFRQIADATGSLEANVGYIDLRLHQGATPAELRAEYDQRGAAVSPQVRGFVDAYLVARRLPDFHGPARDEAIDGAIATLRRVMPSFRGKPEPQLVWGSLLAERFLESGDFAAAQKANVHFLLALELVGKNVRYRSQVLSQLETLQARVGNYHIALDYIDDRDKLPFIDGVVAFSHQITKARALRHVDRQEEAADAADEAVAMVGRKARLAIYRPLALDRAALCNLAAGRFERALALYDELVPLYDAAADVAAQRNRVVARLARAAAALGAKHPRRALADLDVVDARIGDTAIQELLLWPHNSAAATLRGYKLIASGLRANADISLHQLDDAARALDERRAVLVEQQKEAPLDARLRALALVHARLADVERDRGNAAAAARWLKLALKNADAFVKKSGVPLNTEQLDILRFAAELRLDHGLGLRLHINMPRRLKKAYDKLVKERDPAFRDQTRWYEIYLALFRASPKLRAALDDDVTTD